MENVKWTVRDVAARLHFPFSIFHSRFFLLFPFYFFLFFLFHTSALNAAIVLKDDYRSPRNKERSFRKRTTIIVLHTTEAPANSSLNKLSERGEAHYCVTEKGEVYRIVDRDREAFHAGQSMWNAKEDCDEFSVGIEVVGHHDQAMPMKQIDALRELVDRLKKIYNLKDAQVVCHSQVAYGRPNRWHKCKHRGRKRCGMLFAMPSVRSRLGLTQRPAYDPDVKAKRLVQVDPYLESVLYGKTDTMTAYYGRASVKPLAPAQTTSLAMKPKGSVPKPKGPVPKVVGPVPPPKGPVPKVAGPVPPPKGTVPKVAGPVPPPKGPVPKVAGPVPPPKGPVPKVVGPVPPPKGTVPKVVGPVPPPKGTVPPAVVVAPIVKPPLIIPDEPKVENVETNLVEKGGQSEKEGSDWLTLLGLKGQYFQKKSKTKKVEGTPDPAPGATGEVLPLPDNLVINKMGSEVRDLKVLASLPGYTRGGPVSATLSPYKIAGAAWNDPTTYYVIRGKILKGDEVDEKSIESGTFIFYRKK